MLRRIRLIWAAAAAVAPLPAGAQTNDWSGFYLGVEAGGASADVDAVSTDTVNQLTNVNPAGPQPITVVPATSANFDQSESDTGFVYGAFAGFLGQSGNWVFGIEGDLQGPRDASAPAQTSTLAPTILSPASTLLQERDTEIRYSWSLRGRVGITTGRTLFYAAGGVTGARVELEAVNTYTIPAGNSASGIAGPAIGPIVTTASERRMMTGWTAGIGGETMLGGSLGAGVDLRYSDYGNKTFDLTDVSITRSGATTFPGAEGDTGTIGPPLNDPRSDPGPTRLSLAEWRFALRLFFRF